MYLQTVLKGGHLWAYCLISSGLSYSFPSLCNQYYSREHSTILEKDASCVQSSDGIVNELYWKEQVGLSESLLSECASSKYASVHKTPPRCLKACLPFCFHVFRLLRISTKWKIGLFQSLLPQGTLVLFYHLLGHHRNLLEMKSWYFPERTLSWAWEHRDSTRCIIDEVWPLGLGARDDKYCKDSALCHTAFILNFFPG